MDYKEAYDDICKKLMSAYNTTSFIEVKKAIGQIHPELAESEDEKIRKEIISLVLKVMGQEKDNLSDDKYNAMLAWLEKQKEQKPADDKAFEEWIDDWWKHNKVNNPDSYDKGDEIQFDEKGFKNFCRGIRNMYQQKPAEWSEEDEMMLSSIIGTLKYTNGASNMKIDRLKSLRPSWKPTEEQMNAIDRCVDYLEESDNEDAEIMESLQEQLHKLM